jgi:hypothetical protein
MSAVARFSSGRLATVFAADDKGSGSVCFGQVRRVVEGGEAVDSVFHLDG